MASLQEILSYRRIVIAVVLVVCLFSLVPFNTDTTLFVDRLYNNRPSAPSPSKTDVADVPARLTPSMTPDPKFKSEESTLDIVVSIYKEDAQESAVMLEEIKEIESLRNLTIRTFVYTKDSDADVDALKREFETSRVQILPNLGREADTYFTHILDQYADLARHTMFIQAEMHSFDGAKLRIRDWFRPNTGVLSLGQYESCDCVECRDPWNGERTFPRIGELYSALSGELCPEKIDLTYLGQIIVSAERIRSRGPSTYKYLRDILDSDKENFIHTDPRQDFFKDEPSEPYFGHTVERSYMVLWDCANRNFAEHCGGLEALHTERSENLPDDYCQCLDSPS